MTQNSVLLIDGEKEYQKRLAEVIEKIAPGKTKIIKITKLDKAREIIEQGEPIAAIVIDNNLAGGQDTEAFLSALSKKKKNKVIIYSNDSSFRHKCYIHQSYPVAKKLESLENITSLLRVLLGRTLR